MDYFIAIYTKNKEYLQYIKDKKIIILTENDEIIDNFQTINNTYFDYLITDDFDTLTKLNVMFDKDKVLTNFDLQTSLENVFAFADWKKKINNQWNDIKIEQIINVDNAKFVAGEKIAVKCNVYITENLKD